MLTEEPLPGKGSERQRVLALLKRHGWNTTSFQVLEPDFRYWFPDDDACVAYVDTGHAWVAGGAPIAAEPRLADIAEQFAQAAQAHRRRARFFATEARFLNAANWNALPIGEQPFWTTARWDESLKSSRSLREQLRRARAKGVEVRIATSDELARDGALRDGMERITREWLHARTMAPMGFLVQLHLFSFPTERRLFVAEQNGALVGFLNAVPIYARAGWLLEDVLRGQSAPNGTAELLVDAAMRAAVSEQVQTLTMGLVPLAGRVEGWLRAGRQLGSGFYDFRGLRAFKTKLRPHAWEPVFLSYPKNGWAPMAVLDSLHAFARGDFLRFGMATLLRGPTALVRAMALLLIPWTALLGAASAERWFPSPAVKWSWVGFDVLLTIGLFALLKRFSMRLSLLLTSLVTLDAGLTLFEALTFNRVRAGDSFERIAVGAACLAPLFAAFLLWRAHLRRSIPQ